MNESKLRKGTKYVVLKDEDVHTVTGALKQFFRELKTDLIPIEIVRRLPDDLGNYFSKFFFLMMSHLAQVIFKTFIYWGFYLQKSKTF